MTIRTTATLAELEEEHGGEDGFLGALDKINKAEVNARLKEIKGDKDAKEETTVLKQWLQLNTEEAEIKKAIRDAEIALDLCEGGADATLSVRSPVRILPRDLLGVPIPIIILLALLWH